MLKGFKIIHPYCVYNTVFEYLKLGLLLTLPHIVISDFGEELEIAIRRNFLNIGYKTSGFHYIKVKTINSYLKKSILIIFFIVLR